jgi:hypothetical protein
LTRSTFGTIPDLPAGHQEPRDLRYEREHGIHSADVEAAVSDRLRNSPIADLGSRGSGLAALTLATATY